MEVFEVNTQEYNKYIIKPYHKYGLGDFANLNAEKVEEVYYLLFSDGKIRLGLTGGIKGDSFFSPFSAPFGGFNHLKEDIKINQIDNACFALIEWAKTKGLKSIKITLPPSIYNESFISKQINALFRSNFIINNIELNYSYNTCNFDNNYASNIWYNASKNLNIGLKNNLHIKKCFSIEQKKIAYEVIRQNRVAKSFPLRMSWDQIEETTKLIDADFFLCHDQFENAIASTIAFHVSKNIIQIIYWGDIPDYSNLKTMNYMSYEIFNYYKNQNISIIDIGPSTENSIPNYGLCEFKESIGCDISTKLSFEIIL